MLQSDLLTKLEYLIFNGGDIMVPTIEGDEWGLIDAEDNFLSSGKTLESALYKMNAPKICQFRNLKVGERFLYLGEEYEKESSLAALAAGEIDPMPLRGETIVERI